MYYNALSFLGDACLLTLFIHLLSIFYRCWLAYYLEPMWCISSIASLRGPGYKYILPCNTFLSVIILHTGVAYLCSPLTITNWLPVIACDVHTTLSDVLGYEATDQHHELGPLAMEEEMLKSMRSGNTKLLSMSTTEMGLGTDDYLRTEFLRTSADSTRSSQSLTLQAGALSQLGASTSFSLQRRVQRQLLFANTASVELLQGTSTVLVGAVAAHELDYVVLIQLSIISHIRKCKISPANHPGSSMFIP